MEHRFGDFAQINVHQLRSVFQSYIHIHIYNVSSVSILAQVALASSHSQACFSPFPLFVLAVLLCGVRWPRRVRCQVVLCFLLQCIGGSAVMVSSGWRNRSAACIAARRQRMAKCGTPYFQLNASCLPPVPDGVPAAHDVIISDTGTKVLVGDAGQRNLAQGVSGIADS